MASNGLIAEVVREGMGGQERVERHTNVRSVSVPSTLGMVSLDDVVDIFKDNDSVPPHAIRELRQAIEDDPSTGGHIAIETPSTSSHTADFDRIDIYPPLEHAARGSFVVSSEQTWLKTVIPRDLDAKLDKSEYHPHYDQMGRSEIVTAALEQFLDDSDDADPLADAADDDLVAELEQRGYDIIDESGDTDDRSADVQDDGHDNGATDGEVEAAVDDSGELPEFEELVVEDVDADEHADNGESDDGADQDNGGDDSDALDDTEGGSQDDEQNGVAEDSLATTAQEILGALDEHAESSLSELEHITERTRRAISNNLRQLRDDGRVEARKDPDDGRRQLYSLADGYQHDSDVQEDVDETDAGGDDHRVGDPIDDAADQASADGGQTTSSSGPDLPPGLTADEVRDAVDAAADRRSGGQAYLDDVADELNVRPGRARVFAVEVGVYERVTDASGPKGGGR